VDDDACRGHGICVAICPEVFTLTDGGYAEAIGTDIRAELEGAGTEAIASCPERAIQSG
jgi:ferredoxin